MIGLLLLVAGGVGGLYLLVRGDKPASSPLTSTPLRVSGCVSCCSSCASASASLPPSSVLTAGQAAGPSSPLSMVLGQTYRVTMGVAPAYQTMVKAHAARKKPGPSVSAEAFLVATVRGVAERMGLRPLLVIHDPTDERVWTVLATAAAPVLQVPKAVRIMNLQPVEAVPSSSSRDASSPRTGEVLPSHGLDKTLSPDEVEAIRYALAEDDDTKHLGGFASTFSPEHPIAAGLLQCKSRLAAIRSYKKPPALVTSSSPGVTRSDKVVSFLQKVSQGLGPSVSQAWEKYKGLRLEEADRRALGAVVQDITQGRLRPTVPLPVTPAALQLAYATRRPEISLVANPKAITDKFEAIARAARAGEPDARKAQQKLAAANRYLERLQWVEWYKRTSKLYEDGSGPSAGSVTGGFSVPAGRLMVQGRGGNPGMSGPTRRT